MSENNSETKGKTDFPTYLPSLLVKELRQGMKGYGFVVFLAAFPFAMSIPFFLYLVPALSLDKDLVNNCFWIGVLAIFIGFTPLRAISSVVREKKTGSAELISLTGMSASKVILQKWVSFMTQGLLLGVIILPFYFLRYFLGGVELINDSCFLLIILSVSCILTAVGLWISGFPALYRVFYYMFNIQAFVMLLVLVFSSSEFTDIPSHYRSHIVLFYSLAFFWGAVVTVLFCRFFLNLGARWFAMPSDNLSYPLRKNLIWMFCVLVLLTLSMSLFPLKSFELWDGAIKIWYLVVLQVIMGICCIDIILPSTFLPVHARNLREKKGLGRWLTPLFLPGWQSSILFFIVLMSLCSLVMAGMTCAAGRPEKAFSTAFLLILPACDTILLTTLLQPIFKRTGSYSLVIYILVATLCSFVISILFAIVQNVPGNELWIPAFNFLPMGNTIASLRGFTYLWDAPTTQDIIYGRVFFLGRCFFISLSLGVYIICSAPFWKRYCKMRKEEKALSQDDAH